MRYNKDKSKAKIAKYIPYDKIGKANVEVIRRKLLSIYAGTDNTVADGIAIEHGNKIYVVDSGKENGKINFGVRKAISIGNPILRQERLDKINERAISDGYVSGELFGQFKRASNNSSGSSIRRESREELSADTGKSQDNQERVPGENGDRGRNLNSDIKFSRKSQDETFEEVPGGVKVHFNDIELCNNDFEAAERARLREFNEQYNADVKRTAEILDEIVKEASNRALPVTSREYGKDKAAGQAVAEAERDRLFEEQMQNYTYEYENEKKGHCHFKSRPCYERGP